MKLDISRANLTEKDIEDWLYENRSSLFFTGESGGISIERWFGRQYQLPSGIADLIGVCSDGRLAVIEVKNVPINKAAVLQVCRYAADLEEIAGYRLGYPGTQNWESPKVQRVLFGPDMDSQTFLEAMGLGVDVYLFAATLRINVTQLRFTKYSDEVRREKHESIAAQPEWNIYGMHVADAVVKHRLVQDAAASADEPSIEPQVTDEYDKLMDAITTEQDEDES